MMLRVVFVVQIYNFLKKLKIGHGLGPVFDVDAADKISKSY